MNTRARLVRIVIACCALMLTACGKPGPIMPSFVNTPTPTQTGKQNPTGGPDATPTNTGIPATPTPAYPPVTPVPESTSADGTDFFAIMRLLAQGTRVDVTGASKNDIERCFYAETPNITEATALMGLGFTEAEAKALYKIRSLYYRTDGNIYIGEIYVRPERAAELVHLLKNAYETGEKFIDMSAGFADAFFDKAGFKLTGVMSDRREFLYVK